MNKKYVLLLMLALGVLDALSVHLPHQVVFGTGVCNPYYTQY